MQELKPKQPQTYTEATAAKILDICGKINLPLTELQIRAMLADRDGTKELHDLMVAQRTLIEGERIARGEGNRRDRRAAAARARRAK